jgi:3'(2'), 5'-bisphosphate nucleotidase
MTYESELAVAIAAVETASRLCLAVRRQTGNVAAVYKPDRSPVTIADFGSQAVMSLALEKAFPNDAVLAEEDAALLCDRRGLLGKVHDAVLQTGARLTRPQLLAAIERGAADPPPARRFWTMDPIDGTKGFLRNDQFAVALALIESGKVVLGVLGCPAYVVGPEAPHGALFFAARGAGAFERPLFGTETTPLHVCDVRDRARLRHCESVEPAHADHKTQRRIAEFLGIGRSPLRMDSQAKYGAVARGDAALYLRLPRKRDYREKIWDHAAGSILVTEAGGAVSDFEGRPLVFAADRHLVNRHGIIACSRRIHRPALEAIHAAASGRTAAHLNGKD